MAAGAAGCPLTCSASPPLQMHHPSRVAFEKLLRKLLRRPRPPAVLLLHHWCWWQGFKTGLQSEDPRGLYDEPDTELDLTLIGQVRRAARRTSEVQPFTQLRFSAVIGKGSRAQVPRGGGPCCFCVLA